MGLGDAHAPCLGAPAERLAENVAEIDHGNLRIRHAGNLERGHAAGILHLELDLFFVEFSGAQALRTDSRAARRSPGQRIEHAILGAASAWASTSRRFFAHLGDGDFHRIAHDLVDVAPDISHFGELGRFHFEERRLGEPGQPARNLGFADAGGADHQDVLRHHFLA